MERINATTGSYNFIDLFAGAGGLSEGFIQAGFSPVAHVEMNPYAAQTLETRTGYYYLKAQGNPDFNNEICLAVVKGRFLKNPSTVEYKVINDTVLYMKEMNK